MMTLNGVMTLSSLKEQLYFNEMGKVEREILSQLGMNQTECTVELLNDEVREIIKKKLEDAGYIVKDAEKVPELKTTVNGIKSLITITL